MSILDEIVAWKREELAQAQQVLPLEVVKARAAQPPPRDFAAALQAPDGRLRLIAEVKRASPSAGVLRADLDPVAFARTYAHNGAAAISVLTEGRFFQGSLSHLWAIREVLDQDDALLAADRPPLLRKDFLFDPYQIYEARAYGADAVLLIAAILEPAALGELLGLVRSLGMEALVEVHDAEEVRIALDQGASLIGINNRDLRTFTTDLETTRRLRACIPPEVTVVSESGIRGPADLARLRDWGAQAVLIGEAIVTAPDVAAKVREFAGFPLVE